MNIEKQFHETYGTPKPYLHLFTTEDMIAFGTAVAQELQPTDVATCLHSENCKHTTCDIATCNKYEPDIH